MEWFWMHRTQPIHSRSLWISVDFRIRVPLLLALCEWAPFLFFPALSPSAVSKASMRSLVDVHPAEPVSPCCSASVLLVFECPLHSVQLVVDPLSLCLLLCCDVRGVRWLPDCFCPRRLLHGDLRLNIVAAICVALSECRLYLNFNAKHF